MVEMVRVDVAGLVFVMVTLVVEKLQLAPVGNPLEHPKETELGYVGIGVTVTWYVAGGC